MAATTAAMPIATLTPADLLLLRQPANALRLVIAGILLAAGSGMGLGQAVPSLFFLATVGYLVLAVALAVWPISAKEKQLSSLVAAAGDALFYGLFLVSSHGFASGLPTLLFVQVVVAAVEISTAKMALFYAALAALVLLAENLWRSWVGGGGSDPFFVGIVGAALLLTAGLAQRLGERLRHAEKTRVAQESLLAWQRQVNDRIVRELADGVLWIDEQQRVRYASPRVVSWLGRDPTGEPLAEVVPVAIAPGEERWWQHSGQLWRLKGGARDADGMWLLFLTDFAAVQRTFRQERLAALGLLLAGVAHEIRNPLAGVGQALDLLRDASNAKERQMLVALADRNVARIAQMVEEVLVLGRQNPPQPQAVALVAWFAAWCAELPSVEQQRVVVRQEAHPTTDDNLFCSITAPATSEPIAWVDLSHWRTIVTNLVHNALAFASPAAGAVTISVAAAGSRVMVAVVDDGPGLAPEVEAHLFEPFVSKRPNGTGLGLYLAHELVRANGGELRYQRAATGGACFTVWLPRAEAAKGEAAA